jgi:hypothetical protein
VNDLFKKVYVKVENMTIGPLEQEQAGPKLLKKVAGNCVKKEFKQ